MLAPMRAEDWFRQADADLALARHAAAGGHHEWACFAAQQAAEKAVKAVHLALGGEGWGHSVTELLEALAELAVDTPAPLLDRGRALDKLYIPTRYPNGLPAGAPADYFTEAEAHRGIADAEAVLAFCRTHLSD
jgi:HEPN domain-containing protein